MDNDLAADRSARLQRATAALSAASAAGEVGATLRGQAVEGLYGAPRARARRPRRLDDAVQPPGVSSAITRTSSSTGSAP